MDDNTLGIIVSFLDPTTIARARSVFRPLPYRGPLVITNDDDSITVIDEDGKEMDAVRFAIDNSVEQLIRWLIKTDTPPIIDTAVAEGNILVLGIALQEGISIDRLVQRAVLFDNVQSIEFLLRFASRIDIMEPAIELDSRAVVDYLIDEGFDRHEAVDVAMWLGNVDLATVLAERFGIDIDM